LTLSFEDRVSVPENVMCRELEGESVILNIDTETYFGLDDVGTRMWQVLTESETVRKAYEILLEEYDVEPDLLRRDLMGLIENLAQKGLLVIESA
jgi:hypothetical protein